MSDLAQKGWKQINTNERAMIRSDPVSRINTMPGVV
nr:MAG TPA: hypothetical protein [Caudoviricetes sp.]